MIFNNDINSTTASISTIGYKSSRHYCRILIKRRLQSKQISKLLNSALGALMGSLNVGSIRIMPRPIPLDGKWTGIIIIENMLALTFMISKHCIQY